MTEEKASLNTKDYLNFSINDFEQIILKDCRSQAYTKINLTNRKLFSCRNLLLQLEERSWNECKIYKSLDRELAMIDGRFQVLLPEGERKKVRTKTTESLVVQLTSDQIQRIAETLGVELEIEED